MNDIKDFEIENGLLIKYVGKDTTVVIPMGGVKVDKLAYEDSNVLEIIMNFGNAV